MLVEMVYSKPESSVMMAILRPEIDVVLFVQPNDDEVDDELLLEGVEPLHPEDDRSRLLVRAVTVGTVSSSDRIGMGSSRHAILLRLGVWIVPLLPPIQVRFLHEISRSRHHEVPR